MSIQSIRDNSQSLVAKVIVGLIVVTFALFGVDAIVGYSSNSNNIAEVNGDDITLTQLNRATEMLRRQILDRMGENADPGLLDENLIKSRALDGLIERQLLIQDADSQGIYVDENRVGANIRNNPVFQVEGQFNQNIFEATVRNIGLLPREYKDQLTIDMQIQQPQAAIAQSAFMSPTEVKQLAELDRQLRNIAYLRINSGDLIKDIEISEARAKAYYEANQQNYMTTEQVQLEYLELKRDDFKDQVAVSEEELKQLYKQELERTKGQEERQAAHILVQVGDDRDEASARNIMQEIQEKLTAGESFADLAKIYSDDPGSAESGGDLGYAQRGSYVDTFEHALFNMQKGQISDVVKTEFGLHLIQLLDVRTPEPRSYEELAPELEQDIRYQKAEELFVAAADELQNDSFSAGDLAEPAERMGLKIQTTAFFSRTGGEGIAENPKVARVAFSDEVLTEGNNSDLIELSKDHVVVVRVKEYRPAKVLPYEEVAEQVQDQLKQRNAAMQAQKLGEQILVELRDGKTPEQITSDYGFEWNIKDRVGRNQEELDPQINTRVFKMAKPEVGGKSLDSLILDNGDFVVIALTKVYEGGVTEITPREIEVISNLLANQQGRYDLQDYMTELRRSADIEKY